MNDGFPLVVDKSKQIIFMPSYPGNIFNTETAKNMHAYGRNSKGKLVSLLHLENTQAQQSLTPFSKSIEPYPPKDVRFMYRASTGHPVVYIPSSSQPHSGTIPVPAASYLVTSSPPAIQQPVQLQIIPAATSFPQTSFTPVSSYSTFSPIDDQYYNTHQENDMAKNECDGNCDDTSMEEKCNSSRLRAIILKNIVKGDGDASKRAVQSSAEAETGLYFNTICGTGFFSYIAHTDEFCLASTGGINCYVFSPVCTNNENTRKYVNKS